MSSYDVMQFNIVLYSTVLCYLMFRRAARLQRPGDRGGGAGGGARLPQRLDGDPRRRNK